ncbi:MAG: triose-phosphate isomerase [Thermodesulfovibrionales bacterium]|nr:triose-phosphate isomerase [Thermodesulfovibrionales bacterium]
MRTPCIAANWKLQKTVAEVEAFIDAFLPLVKDNTTVEIVLAPVFTALHAAGKKLAGSNVGLSSQDVYHEEKGAFTGEVSPSLLMDVGCKYAIVGHSERREYFNETDEFLNKKAKAIQAAGMTVIFCCGEPLSVRESGKTNDLLAGQLDGGLKGLDTNKLILAYEPIWAIGTGVTASPEQAQETHKFIRSHIEKILGADAAASMRIQYGGSVKPGNVKELMACEDVDGALVGGASLEAESFAQIVNFGG